MADISVFDMLTSFGVVHSEHQKARDVLYGQGVIQKSPNRENIAQSKIDCAHEALYKELLWHCNNGKCRSAARSTADRRPLLLVEQRFCNVCGGCPSARLMSDMSAALRGVDLKRILVVGGTEKKRREINEKCPSDIEWRFIEGTKARDDRYYRDHRDWADVIVIWQSTPLGHRVSAHFTASDDDRVIIVPRRGLDCLASEIIRHCQR